MLEWPSVSYFGEAKITFPVQYGVNVLRKRVNLHNPNMLNVTKSHVTK